MRKLNGPGTAPVRVIDRGAGHRSKLYTHQWELPYACFMNIRRYTRSGLAIALVSLLVCLGCIPAMAIAETVILDNDGLRLNGKLEKSAAWPAGVTLLVTHGTLSHRDSEIIRTLQELFLEQGVSSLAVNLSLGRPDREGSFDCTLPHTHRHEDAVGELTAWLSWLGGLGAKQVVPLGHSRGANQTAWFTSESRSALLKAQILVAPPVGGSRTADNKNEAAGELERARAHIRSGKPQAELTMSRFLYCEDATVTAASLVSYYGDDSRLDTRTLLREGELPTLVVLGSEDETVPGLPEAWSGDAGRANVEVLVIDGADHFFRDLYADELVEAAMEFIQGLPAQ